MGASLSHWLRISHLALGTASLDIWPGIAELRFQRKKFQGNYLRSFSFPTFNLSMIPFTPSWDLLTEPLASQALAIGPDMLKIWNTLFPAP